MKRLSKASQKRRNKSVLPQGASSSILALFFSFFFIFAQAADFTVSAGEIYGAENSTLSHGTHLFGAHHERHHLPFNSVPIPQESESKNEREKSHESDDDSDKILAILSLKERLDVSSDKCLLLQLLNSRHNRKERSLFILHHSWKSFLS